MKLSSVIAHLLHQPKCKQIAETRLHYLLELGNAWASVFICWAYRNQSCEFVTACLITSVLLLLPQNDHADFKLGGLVFDFCNLIFLKKKMTLEVERRWRINMLFILMQWAL